MRTTLEVAPDPFTGLRRFFESLMVDFEAAGFTGGCLIANLGAQLERSDICRDTLKDAFRTWGDDVAVALGQSQQLGLVRADVDAGDLADLLTDAWEGAVIRMKIERSLDPLHRVTARLLDDYFRPRERFFWPALQDDRSTLPFITIIDRRTDPPVTPHDAVGPSHPSGHLAAAGRVSHHTHDPANTENRPMPQVHFKITREGGTTPEQKVALIAEVTDLLVTVLDAPPATTFVVINEVELEDWGVVASGGRHDAGAATVPLGPQQA